ncbi:MAG TPA: formyltransferase family protein [Gaiellaceae bacterium]|nr:formyltransferase family protein [Gaiellaceae bacterium]
MTGGPSWRVAIVTRVPPVLEGFHALLREKGHEPVALLTVRHRLADSVGPLAAAAPPDLDILVASSRARIAPLLESVRPDLVVCMGFPWKVPRDALAVPRLGWLNGHPSLLPRHRGPIPVAWAIRDGDATTGVTFHRMDAELDTGPVLAQTEFPLGEYEPPDVFFPRMGEVVGATLAEALDRLAAGEEGTPQAAGGEYQGFFGSEDVRLDLSRPALENHRLVWAWRYAIAAPGAETGALLELDGEPVRVLASSLEEREGARRVECADGPLWLLETEPAA